MANFEPKWEVSTDLTSVSEGQTSTTVFKISKNKPLETSNVYEVKEDQYLQFSFSVSSSGETFDYRDINLQCTDNSGTLVPIETVDPLNPNKTGNFIVKYTQRIYDLSSVASMPALTIKLQFIQDGVWDGPESISIVLDSIILFSTIEGQISNEEISGVITSNTSTIQYNSTSEIWVTPSLTARGENYCIAEIGYGADSTMFVQAFGKSRPYNASTDGTADKSNRVYVPMYTSINVLSSDIPSSGITELQSILTPTASDVTAKKEQQRLLVRDITGTDVQSGLSFCSTGQILFNMIYQSEPTDAYLKVRIVPMTFYENAGQQYYIGKRFRAYQTWIAPNSDSALANFTDPKPLKNHVYMLNDTSVYPYTVQEVVVQGTPKIEFKPEIWKDMGYYDSNLGSGIVGSERVFRIVLNSGTGDGLDFETDPDLGTIHVGEYYGHSVYPIIKASGSDIVTYRIDPNTSPNDIRNFNLDLSPSGALIGTAYARSSEFNANDEIPLEFDVIATGKNGKSSKQRFNLRIIRGLQEHTLSAYIVPSTNFERAWFGCIGGNAFNNMKLYRPWDERYGLQKTPRILIKENYVGSSFNWVSLDDTKQKLRDSIIDTENSAPVPDSNFSLVLGNYKVRTAMDKNGNLLYDVLYREIHDGTTKVDLSTKCTEYSDIGVISEYYGLRQNIFKILGEDTQNLLTDPDDLQNRGLFVEAQDGLSVEMLDTVPRFMNHVYEGAGAKNGMLVCAVVAYLVAGTGEMAFNELMSTQEHSKLLGTKFDVPFVQFKSFYGTDAIQDSVQNSFMIPLKGTNLLQ